MKNKEMLWKNNGVKIHDKINVIGQAYIQDYKYVKNTEGNRPFTTGLKHLQDSMNLNGVCSTPIAVKDKSNYIIVDGWHRKHILDKKLGIPMIVTLVEPNCTINELMIILNTTQVNWNAQAYLNNGIVVHNNSDMKFLEEVWEETGLSLSALYEIYSYDLSSAKAKESFENGTWTASTKSLGNRVVKYSEELNKYMPFSLKARFLQGFVVCVNKSKYNQKHMLSQAKRYPNHIHAVDSPPDYRKMLNFLYNHRREEEEQLYIA